MNFKQSSSKNLFRLKILILHSTMDFKDCRLGTSLLVKILYVVLNMVSPVTPTKYPTLQINTTYIQEPAKYSLKKNLINAMELQFIVD